MKLVKRASWGARTPDGTGNEISPNPYGVAVHYADANTNNQPHEYCGPMVQSIQKYHMDTKGWADIAYSFLVCQHGFIYEGRGKGKGSAANGTTKANFDYYAVCALIGPSDTPAPDLLYGIGEAIALCRQAGANLRVLGHRDLFATSCPGEALYGYVKNGHWNSGKPIPTTAPVSPKPTPPKPHAIPVSNRPPQIAVDGVFGQGTKKRLQQWAGVVQDGNLGPISWRAIQRKVGNLIVDGNPGEKTWKAIQRMVGAEQDGAPGAKTYRALQQFLNTH